METIILRNDAFNSLLISINQKGGGTTANQLECDIFGAIANENLYIEPVDWGHNLAHYFTATGYELQKFFINTFPKVKPSIEDYEVFGALVLFGMGDCPECGGNLKQEQGKITGRWATQYDCEQCDYTTTKFDKHENV